MATSRTAKASCAFYLRNRFLGRAVACLALALGGIAFGQSWTNTGAFGNWSSLAMTGDGQKLAAASYNEGIFVSTNSGGTWTNLGTPDTNHWAALTTSTNGGNLVSAFFNGAIFRSADWGGSWTPSSAPTNTWSGLASSADGTRLVAGNNPGILYFSKDGGATFYSRLPENNGYQGVAGSSDGQTVFAAAFNGGIYKSTDAGQTWTATTAPIAQWSGIASSADGTKLAATAKGNRIFLSTDSGAHWEAAAVPVTSWGAIASSADGSKLAAIVDGGPVFTSQDSGATWQTQPINTVFSRVASTADTIKTTILSTNATTQKVVTNSSTSTFSSVNRITTSTLSVTARVGLKVATPKTLTGTNTVAVTGQFGLALSGSNLVAFQTVSTNAYGTNVLGIGTAIPSVSESNIATVTLPLPQSIGSVSNSAVTVVATNLPNLAITVSNFLSASAATAVVPEHWSALASSADGTRLAVVEMGGGIFLSTNSGANWNAANAPATNWSAIASSADGTKMAATVRGGLIYTSTDGGVNWAASTNNPPGQNWSGIASSADGTQLIAAANDGSIFVSTNGGFSWAATSAPRNLWSSMLSSADGNTLVVLGRFAPSYQSADGGLSWSKISAPVDEWKGVASSADGGQLAAASSFLYHSADFGATWSPLNAVLKTNLFVTNFITGTVIATNTITVSKTKHSRAAEVRIARAKKKRGARTITVLSTNHFTVTFATNLAPTSLAPHFANTLQVQVPAATVTDTNTESITTEAGVTLDGGDLFALSPVNVIAEDTNTLSAGTVVLATNVTQTVPNDPVIFYPPGNVITNFVDVTDQTSVAVGNISVTNLNIAVTNTLVVSVLITNVPQEWIGVASSGDGTHLAAAVNGGFVYTSTNSGVSWTASVASNANWLAITLSADGKTLAALAGNGWLYTSPDFGNTWAVTNVPASAFQFGSLAVSANGGELAAALYQGQIYSGQNPYAPQVLVAPVTSVPALRIFVVGGSVVLAWPAGSTTFTLQESAQNAWTDVAATPTVTNGENQVVLPMADAHHFFRLRK